MTVDQRYYPNGDNEPNTLTTRVSELDNAREAFEKQARRFVRLPTARRTDSLADSSNAVAHYIHSLIKAIIDDPEINTITEKADLIASLMYEDEAARVKLLNEIQEKDSHYMSVGGRERLVTLVTDLLSGAILNGTQADVLLISIHAKVAESDLTKAVELACTSPRGRLLEIAPVIGSSMLRIAEIGTGVALGIWFSNKTKRPKN